jgi:signal transduction histidine kinase
VRRRWPLAALLLAIAGAVGHHMSKSAAVEPLDLVVPIALFALANADQARRRAAVTFAVMMIGIGALSVLQPFLRDADTTVVKAVKTDRSASAAGTVPVVPIGPPERLAVHDPKGVTSEALSGLWRGAGLMFLLGFAYLLGANMRGRRIHLRTLEQRATDLEREQQQRVALATAAERARITRELHDVVAHGLSVMVVQAQGGAAALRRHPERTEAALQNVIATGRSSLDEMRRLLAVAREDPRDDPELAPPPGVDALPGLVDTVRAAGTPVTFAVEGDPVPLPAGVDLSAYRITQEALTNTLKHAGDGASATVRLGFRPDRLEIEVHDDGTGARPAAAGHGNGLRGIRERVGMLGGELSAGPMAAGGFRVRAVLPLGP